jgi:hypothetical protein
LARQNIDGWLTGHCLIGLDSRFRGNDRFRTVRLLCGVS